MDPALEEIIPGPPDDIIEAMIRLRTPRRMPEGFRAVARFGDVATGRLRRGDIERIWADPGVVSLKAPRLLELAEGPAGQPPWTPASGDMRRPPVPETGRGIVVGVIDWGLDVTCPAFRAPSGATRLLAMWDQRDRHGCTAKNLFGYGRIYTRAAINAALGSSEDPHRTLVYHPADADPGDGTHGTHVLDIAAGNGRHGGPLGMAPEADCVFVHLAAGSLGGLANLGDSLRICEALEFIRQIAGPRPFVVNMSVGRHASSHTGTTLLERAVDALVEEKPGRAVVMSTGNYYQADAHASGRLVPGRSEAVTWLVGAVDPTINELEIWYPDCDTIRVRLEGPGGNLLAEADLDQTVELQSGDEVVGRLYHRAFDPNTRDHHVNLFLYPGAPVGAWRLTLLPGRIRDGRWHAWVERDTACRACQSRFDPREADPTHTIGSICNGFLSIAVGALDTTSNPPRVARFSSSGPTRDGRAKPDLVAPGVAILAARSGGLQRQVPPLTRKSGASQAAPFVAGAIALVFEAARRPLGIDETRAILFGTAAPVPGADPLRVGAGVIDPTQALIAARDYSDSPPSSRPKPRVSPDFAAHALSSIQEPAMHPSPEPGIAFPVLEAARLFDSVFLNGALPPPYAERFDLVAAPGQSLPELRSGDLILHRPLAAPPAADLTLIADPGGADIPRAAELDRILLRLRGPLSTQENPAAAAGAVGVIGAAKDVFDIVDRTVTVLRNNVFNGDYRLTSDVARATPFSRNIAPVAPNTMRVRYTLEAHDPIFANSDLVFYVVMEADCLNIHSVEIGKDDAASSTLLMSSFEINFRAIPEQPPGQRLAVIDFAIAGRWNPRGPGDRSFTGLLRVRADGVMTIRIEPRGGWVRLKNRHVSQMLTACPAADAASSGTPPAAPITPPDGPHPRQPSGGGSRPSSSTAALLSRLPAGPHITHLFFTTSNTRLPVNEVNRLHGWFIRLSPVFQTQIRSGTLPVLVTGHASPSGPADANMAISFQRAQAAARALRDIVGPQAEFRVEGAGSTASVGVPGSNDQADRRATIRISPAVV